MSIEIVKTCPLGSTCERIADGKLERCHWYIELEGQNPQDGSVVKESRCAMTWLPLLSIENSGITNRVAHSVQSLRNETIRRQDKALGLIHAKEIGNT